ncbi:pentapeptide repeat-containing protein [Chloroflexi bacterium TSY]|nr:pentapeptide repeat-containing protein [Chloroflexi bacterium TSY]
MFQAKLEGADLREATLKGANLTVAKLERVDLTNANLKEADLGSANLQEADLPTTNLKGANLEYANLTAAVYDKNTTWPDDFDPSLFGAVRTQIRLNLVRTRRRISPWSTHQHSFDRTLGTFLQTRHKF